MPGILCIVATPIGNLEDLTFRALKTIKEADLIACEDTRRTLKLLEHYGVRKPLLRYDEHSHKRAAPQILRELKSGKKVALVTDAGTPAVSDPGQRLIAEAVREGIPVSPVPGPSAALALLSAAGFPSEGFVFLGFLPRKGGPAARSLRAASGLGKTLIVFEAPYRLIPTLSVIRDALGEVPVCLGRELTKIHEELIRGTPSELLRELSGRPEVLGEAVLAISPKWTES